MLPNIFSVYLKVFNSLCCGVGVAQGHTAAVRHPPTPVIILHGRGAAREEPGVWGRATCVQIQGLCLEQLGGLWLDHSHICDLGQLLQALVPSL